MISCEAIVILANGWMVSQVAVVWEGSLGILSREVQPASRGGAGRCGCRGSAGGYRGHDHHQYGDDHESMGDCLSHFYLQSRLKNCASKDAGGLVVGRSVGESGETGLGIANQCLVR